MKINNSTHNTLTKKTYLSEKNIIPVYRRHEKHRLYTPKQEEKSIQKTTFKKM